MGLIEQYYTIRKMPNNWTKLLACVFIIWILVGILWVALDYPSRDIYSDHMSSLATILPQKHPGAHTYRCPKYAITGEDKLKGILKSADNNGIVVETKQGDESFEYGALGTAKTYFDWN